MEEEFEMITVEFLTRDLKISKGQVSFCEWVQSILWKINIPDF